jgi:Ser/Thr protein kinase RdoA (MazF antagonist)
MADESIEDLKKKIRAQAEIIRGFEKVLKLNEQELTNADEMIRMYERIVDYSRQELRNAQEAMDASSIVSNLSREELISALDRIKELEDANKKLRQEANEIAL